MQTIVAIGGAVIKTAWEEIKEAAQRKMFTVLIHNGGSIFHDFQRATEKLEDHSHTLESLIKEPGLNRKASKLIWEWMEEGKTPEGSLTRICYDQGIGVFLFTGLGCDFWQLFDKRWELIAKMSRHHFTTLCKIMMAGPFHYICMGSAVIHPEVFTKALALSNPKEFRADVVDFLEMYRPRTRIAKYGEYFQMTHKEFLTKWLKGEELWERSLK